MVKKIVFVVISTFLALGLGFYLGWRIGPSKDDNRHESFMDMSEDENTGFDLPSNTISLVEANDVEKSDTEAFPDESDEKTNVTEEDTNKADLYKSEGDAFEQSGNDIHAAIATLEISLQYRKDPEVMYRIAEMYRTLQKTEGDGYNYFWNFDRATQLYVESYEITGDSQPIVSFCEYCDEYIVDPTMSDGYKVKVLEKLNIETVFVKNPDLKEGEYIYHPDFEISDDLLVIETHELPAWILYEIEKDNQ